MACWMQVGDVRYRDWDQQAYLDFDTTAEARKAGFYDYGSIKEVLECKCGAQNVGEMCRVGGCRQCTIHEGDQRNPLLPGAELGGTVASLQMLRECQVPTALLSTDWPLPIDHAAQVKEVLGRYHFKQLTHWGYAVV